MAEVDVKKQTHDQQQGHGELERRGAYPSLFSLHPGEFFNTNPFSLMRRFTDEMDRLFESGGWRRGRTEMAPWSPAVEVTEHDGTLEVAVELPGVKESDIKVEVSDEGLVIQGERKREHEEKGEGYYRSERSYGQFYRLIPLPETAKLDQARAEFHNGELRISVPAPARQRSAREIPISSGERKEPQSQASGAQQTRKAAG
jgi:HSP20 family protein